MPCKSLKAVPEVWKQISHKLKCPSLEFATRMGEPQIPREPLTTTNCSCRELVGFPASGSYWYNEKSLVKASWLACWPQKISFKIKSFPLHPHLIIT